MITTPKKARSLGIFIVLMWLAAPIVEAAYYNIQLSKGAFPVDADSISIPIIQFTIGWLMVTPVIAVVSYWILKHYTPGVSIFIWNHKRPSWSFVITAVFFLHLGLEGKFLINSINKTNLLDSADTVASLYLTALIRASVVAYNKSDSKKIENHV
jgi:hypothetical protein